MSVVYDPSVIQQLAENLYRRANSLVALYSVVGFVAGFALVLTALSRHDIAIPLAFSGGLLGVLVGRLVATPRAFAMRVQAQTLLCQAQIERNTRAAAAAYATAISQAA